MLAEPRFEKTKNFSMRRRLNRLRQRKRYPPCGLLIGYIRRLNRAAVLAGVFLTIGEPKIPRDNVRVQEVSRSARELLLPDNLFNMGADRHKILPLPVSIPCPLADIEEDTQPCDRHGSHLGDINVSCSALKRDYPVFHQRISFDPREILLA